MDVVGVAQVGDSVGDNLGGDENVGSVAETEVTGFNS